MCLAFAPDGKTLVTGSECSDRIRLWDPATGRERAARTGDAKPGIKARAFSPAGRILAAGGHDEGVHLWDPDTGRERRTLRGHVGCVRDVVFSLDGRTLTSVGDDGLVRLWDADGRVSIDAQDLPAPDSFRF
jgi:WD40 repeat protein